MKLRIQGNSLRLRLSRPEVAQLSASGRVEDSIRFGPGASLAYSLESSPDLQAAQALYENGALRVRIPRGAANEWTATDRVGLDGEQPIGDGKLLSIVVEKDFKCIHGSTPDPDAYPNPLEA